MANDPAASRILRLFPEHVSVVGNMINHNSSDGSCSGELFPFGDSTLVLADTQQDAIDLCQSLGGFDVHYSWPDDGWPDLPADTWVCIA